jgi:hypothetical protein
VEGLQDIANDISKTASFTRIQIGTYINKLIQEVSENPCFDNMGFGFA